MMEKKGGARDGGFATQPKVVTYLQQGRKTTSSRCKKNQSYPCIRVVTSVDGDYDST